jgi:G3E family GTPase
VRDEAKAVPVHVVGGFLGSGKTTLLSRLLEHEVACGGRPGVVENEYGGADVDGTLLHAEHRGTPVEIRGLAGGCVCCDLTEELGETVLELATQRRRSAVFVETTGLASLPRVVEALRAAAASKESGGRIRLGAVVGVVDASRIGALLRDWPACDEHLRGVDWVVLNQLDRASEVELSQARRIVGRLAPGARIVETSFAQVDAARLLGETRGLQVPKLPPRDTTEGFRNAGFKLLRPIDLEKLEAVARRFPRTLVRLKGIVRAGPDEAWHEVQWYPGAFSTRPWKAKAGDSYLVAIGRRLPWERFLDGVESCVVRRRARSRR